MTVHTSQYFGIKSGLLRTGYIKKSKRANLAALISGGLVFLASLADNNGFAHLFFSNILGIGSLIIFPILFYLIKIFKFEVKD
jgi:hypothetical protein